MKSHRASQAIAVLGLLAGLATGCGGFSGSRSVSPATFLLPGLIHHQPVAPDPFEAPSLDTNPRKVPIASELS